MQGNRKGKKNGPRAKTRPGVSFVTFCPVCPCTHSNGRQNGAIYVKPTARLASCKEGHRFALRSPTGTR